MPFPSLPSIPNPQLPSGLPTNGFAPKLPAVGPAAFTEGLENVGQDSTLLDIKSQFEAQAAGIGSLDIASLSPGDLSATLGGAQDAIKGSMDSLLSKADQLKPPLIDLQAEIGKLMDPLGIPELDIGGALAEAKAQLPNIEVPDLGSLSESLGIGASLPSISGLDAAIDTLGKASSSLEGVISDAAGSISSALNEIGKGFTAPNLQSLAGDVASGLPSIPSIGEVGIGIPSGLDPGKLIPKLKFENVPEFDADGIQIGTKLVAKKFGVQATAPVADDVDDDNPDPLELVEPAPVAKNPILGDNGLLASAGRATINTFKQAIPTSVSFDPGTGENIVWEGVKKPDGSTEVTASGYASYAEFEAEYKKARAAAKGKAQEYMGHLKQMAGTLSTVFQASAKNMKNVAQSEFVIPSPPADFKPTVFKSINIDTLTGTAVGTEQGAAIEEIDSEDFGEELLDQLGVPTTADKIQESAQRLEKAVIRQQNLLNTSFKVNL